jgi:hypothetical protein
MVGMAAKMQELQIAVETRNFFMRPSCPRGHHSRMFYAVPMQIPALLCKNNCHYRRQPMHGLRRCVAKWQRLQAVTVGR